MKLVQLDEVAEINPRAARKIPDDTEVSFVGMAELNATDAHTNGDIIRKFAEVRRGYTIFADGDILVAKITPCFENNKIGKARLQRAIGVGSTEFHVIRCGEQLDDRYLLHFLRQDQIRRQGELRMTGSAGQRRVPVAFLKQLQIPLPPLDQQRRIAAILDSADLLRAKRRRMLDLLDQLTQSTFVKVFQHVIDDTGSPFADLVDEFRYGTSVKSTPVGHPVLRIPNVLGGSLDLRDLKFVELGEAESDRLRLRDGDLLFVRTNGNRENVGRCAVFTSMPFRELALPADDVVYASYLIRARLTDRVLPQFVATYLNGPGRRQLTKYSRTSAGQYNINIDGLRAVEVPEPPITEQKAFLQRAAFINVLIAHSRTQLAHLDTLMESLQSRAYSGTL